MTSPEEDAQSFREEIETKYNDVAEQLPWTHVPYNKALDQARAAARFLVVYLHNPAHENTNEFVRNALCTPTFKNFLDNNRTLLWGANVRTKEGHMGEIFNIFNSVNSFIVFSYQSPESDYLPLCCSDLHERKIPSLCSKGL